MRIQVMQAEGTFQQQQSNYDELSSYYHSQAQQAYTEIQTLSQQLGPVRSEAQRLQTAYQAESNMVARVSQELREYQDESKQWLRTLGDTQSTASQATRAQEELQKQLQQANFQLAQVQAWYNESKTNLQLSRQSEAQLTQQLNSARQEIEQLKTQNHWLEA